MPDNTQNIGQNTGIAGDGAAAPMLDVGNMNAEQIPAQQVPQQQQQVTQVQAPANLDQVQEPAVTMNDLMSGEAPTQAPQNIQPPQGQPIPSGQAIQTFSAPVPDQGAPNSPVQNQSQTTTQPQIEATANPQNINMQQAGNANINPETGASLQNTIVQKNLTEEQILESDPLATPAEKEAEAQARADAAKGEKPIKEMSKKEKAEELKRLKEAEKRYREGMVTVRDLIAPSSMEVNFQWVRIGELYAKTFFVYSYPRFIEANWMSPIINYDVTMDISMFIYPTDSAKIMKVLRNKVAQMNSSIHMAREKGMVRDPATEAALEDAEELRDQLQRGQEKFFQFGLYFTLYAEDPKKIKKIQANIESIMGGKMVLTRPADLQQEHGFHTVLPTCTDEIEVFRNMNTSPLSTTFPFTSSELTSNDGILYGLNRHNDSLVIFDRFSLNNANSIIFATSGAGKSYTVKLEIIRTMMMGADVIVIDPENEYDELAGVVGGSVLKVSLNSDRRINPFDLPKGLKDEATKPGDLLRSNIITLHGLFNLMLGKMSPSEEGIMDRALIDTYALKGITLETEDPSVYDPPTMADLQEVLEGTRGAEALAERLQKYTRGTFAGLFNQKTNVDLDNNLVVFQVRDLEDSLRPIGIYVILNYIWNRVRSSLKKRMLVVDEAWNLMQHDDSAKFLFGLIKRARKYYLGVTTITQDVEDFMRSNYGKPIVTNSAMQILLKQAPSAVETLQKVFNLTEGEKYLLMNSGVGQGIFFAGNKHVAIQIIASYTEDKIVTTNPEQMLKNAE